MSYRLAFYSFQGTILAHSLSKRSNTIREEEKGKLSSEVGGY